MAKHFPVGVNGTNGIESLAGIIDDQELNSQIQKAAKENSDACMRPMIMDYVSQKDPTLVSKIDTGDMNNEPKEDEPHAVFCNIDETGNMGRINNLRTGASYLRKYKLRITFYLSLIHI